jgi:hypothetical protein
VDELAAAERDPHVRRPSGDGSEEHEIARTHSVLVDRPTHGVLVADLAGQRRAVLGEHPLHESTAVQPSRWLAAAVAVFDAAKCQCRGDDGRYEWGGIARLGPGRRAR